MPVFTPTVVTNGKLVTASKLIISLAKSPNRVNVRIEENKRYVVRVGVQEIESCILLQPE